MSLKRNRRPNLNFGFRLALLYTLFLAFSVAILFSVSYQVVQRVVQNRDRQVIRAQAEQFSTLYHHGGVSAIANYFSQQINPQDAVFVRVVDRLNRVHFITVSHPVWTLLDQKVSTAGGLQNNSRSRWDMLAKEESEGSWIVGTIPLGNSVFLQVGHSNAASQQILLSVRRTGINILLPALLISLLGGWLASRSVLSPLRALVETIRHIVETGDLKRRVSAQDQKGELGTLGAMFNGILDRNAVLVDNSRETLDNVAHDLRTPMTHLRNSAEHALQAQEPDLDAHREALADCMEESERILQTLNALMDLAEAESGGMRLTTESFELSELADEVIELYSIVAEEKSIEIENSLSCALVVDADRLRVRQCLANLVDNALKYSPQGSSVELTGSSTASTVSLCITDQGCGVAPEDQDKIWDRLFRAEPSRAMPGLGLGLSMVRAITEAHGGSVHVESRPQQGSAFTLNFPRGE